MAELLIFRLQWHFELCEIQSGYKYFLAKLWAPSGTGRVVKQQAPLQQAGVHLLTSSSEQEHSDIPFSSSGVTGQRAVRRLPQLSVMCLLEINQKLLPPERQVGALCPCGQDGLAVPCRAPVKLFSVSGSRAQGSPDLPCHGPQPELSFPTCETALRNAYS